MRAPTLREVAEAASVHVATASRALNPQTRAMVSPATADRVLRAARSLGYRPNIYARSLKTARSDSIGVVIPDLTNPLVPPMVRGAEDVLLRSGYNLMVVNTDNDPERERAQIQSLRARQVEGLIVATAHLEHPYLEKLHAEGVPLVLANRLLGAGHIPSVTADNAVGSAMAVEHLAALGHRRIAHVSGPRGPLDRPGPAPRLPATACGPRGSRMTPTCWSPATRGPRRRGRGHWAGCSTRAPR